MLVDDAKRPPHPLGPILLRMHPQHRGRAGLTACICAVILGLAAWLHPDSSGIGTHEQLGLARCTWPQLWGIPCPTCGMTTSFALTVRGRWIAALHTQPLGFLTALATGAVLAATLTETITGRGWRINWYRVPPSRALIGIIALVLLAWGYKILVFRAQMR